MNNAKQIKEGMTQGVWASSGFTITGINNGAVDLWESDDLGQNHDPEINAEAIINSINNTYAKGYDPAKVPDMVKMLEAVLKGLAAVHQDTNIGVLSVMHHDISALLNEVKIK